MVVMMENTNYADVVQHSVARGHPSPSVSSYMPFLQSLLPQSVLLTNYYANYHPSDQNYVAQVAGDTFVQGNIYFPDFNLTARHIGDLLEARGKTWKSYIQGMEVPCQLQCYANNSWYCPDDAPFMQFSNVVGDLQRCQRSLRDLADFATDVARGQLANFVWLAADGFHDGEGANDHHGMVFSLRDQDAFLNQTLSPLLSSPTFAEGKTLVVINWDESAGWGYPDNKIPVFLIGSPGLLREGMALDISYEGYSVLRTAELALGLPHLNRFDQAAVPFSAAFAGSTEQGQCGLRLMDEHHTHGSTEDVNNCCGANYGTCWWSASVAVGAPLQMATRGDCPEDGLSVVLLPWGTEPSPSTLPVDGHQTGVVGGGASNRLAEGVPVVRGWVTMDTAALSPRSVYGAWLLRDSQPWRAPVLVNVVTPPPTAPGVYVLGYQQDSSNRSVFPPLQFY